MTAEQDRNLEARLDRLEGAFLGLERSVKSIEEVLRSSGAYDKLAPAVVAAQPSAQKTPSARKEIYCANCQGGNPPDAYTCMWCGQAVRTRMIDVRESIGPVGRIQRPAAAPISPFVAATQTGVSPGAGFAANPLPPPPPALYNTAGRHPSAASSPRFSFDFLASSDFWLNKVGVGLLLLGVIFLFKYSVDQGWLTPELRLVIGMGISSAMLVTGLILQKRRYGLSQVLIGGSIAAYYTTGFAAFQLFHLLDYIPTFAFMVAVSTFAFAYSLRQNNVLFALIGTLGSLATPFLLATEASSLAGLALYVSLIMAFSGAIYLVKGWRSLLWASMLGTLMVLLLVSAMVRTQFAGEVWVLQVLLVVYLLFFWLLPVVRELLWVRDPARWPRPTLDEVAAKLTPDVVNAMKNHVHFLIAGVPSLVLYLSSTIWPGTTARDIGIAVLLAAALMAFVYLGLRRIRGGASLAYSHLLLALVFFTVSIFLIVDTEVTALALAAEAVVIHLIARRLQDRVASNVGHLVAVLSAMVLAVNLPPYMSYLFTDMTPMFNARSLSELGAIALGFGISLIVVPRGVAPTYRGAAHILLLAWLARELSRLPEGGALIMLAFGIYAAVIFLVAYYANYRTERILSHLIFGFLASWVALWLITYMFYSNRTFSLQGIAALVVILLAAVVSVGLDPPRVAWTYRLGAHAGLLAWLWYELSIFPNGNSYVTISWGIYALALLVVGARLSKEKIVLRMGLATLLMVVAKLILVDFSAVDAIWRILLFIGFGIFFLGLSYYFQGDSRRADQMLPQEPEPSEVSALRTRIGDDKDG